MGQKHEGKADRPLPAAEGQPGGAKPGRKGIWWLIGGLVAYGAAAGYRWWKQLPK